MTERGYLTAKKKSRKIDLAEDCSKRGESFRSKGQFDKAIKEFEKEAKIYDDLGHFRECALAHRSVGEVYSLQEKYDEALDAQRRYLRFAELLDEDRTEEVQRARTMIGQVYIDRVDALEKKRGHANQIADDLEAAKKEIKASMVAIERLKKEKPQMEKEIATMECRALTNLGLISMQQRRMDEAESRYMEAKRKAEEYALGDDKVRVIRNLIEVNFRRSRYEKALEWAEKSGDIKRSTVDVHATWKPKLNLFLNRFDQAKDDLLRAAFAVLNKFSELGSEVHMGELSKKMDAMRRMCAVQEKLDRETDTGPVDSSTYEQFADDLCLFGVYSRAAKFYKLAIAEKKAEGGTNSELAPLYMSLAQTYRDMGEYEKSMDYFELELACYGVDDWKQKAGTYNLMAQSLDLKESLISAVSRMFDKAVEAAEKSGSMITLHTILLDYADFLDRRSCEDEAQKKRDIAWCLPDLPESEEMSEEPLSAGDYNGLVEALRRYPTEVFKQYETCDTRGHRKSDNVFWLGKVVAKNKFGESNLHTAAKEGNVREAKKLLEMRFPVDVLDNANWTALHDAAFHGHTEVMKLLMEHGADIRALGGKEDSTPLMEAAAAGQAEAVKLLLEAGSDPWQQDVQGLTAWEIFWKHCQEPESAPEVPRMLEEAMCPALAAGKMQMPMKPRPGKRDRNKITEDGDDEEELEPRRASRKRKDITGVEHYQNAISSVGRSAAGRNVRELTDRPPDSPGRRVVELSDDEDGGFRAGTRNRRAVSSGSEPDDLDDFIIDDLHEPPAKRKKPAIADSRSASGPSSRHSLARRWPPCSTSTQPVQRHKENRPPASSSSYRSPCPATQPVSRFARSPAPSSPAPAPARSYSPPPPAPPMDSWVSQPQAFDYQPFSAARPPLTPYQPPVFANATVLPPMLTQGAPRPSGTVSVTFRDKAVQVNFQALETFRELLDEAIKLHEKYFGSKPVVNHLMGRNNIVLPLEGAIRSYVSERDEITAVVTHIDAGFFLKAQFGVDIPDWKVAAGVLDLVGRSLDAASVRPLQEALENFPRITELKLGRNRLGDEFFMALSRSDDKFISLKILDLSCNGVTYLGFTQFAQQLSCNLTSLPLLEELNISFNALTDLAADGLATVFEKCRNLRCFLARHCGLTSAVFRNGKFRELLSKSLVSTADLSDNPILCDELFDCFSGYSIERLVLDRIARRGMNVGILTRGTRKLIEKAHNLKSLSIMANGLSDESLKPLQRLESPAARNFELNLSGNALTPRGLAVVLETIGPILRSVLCATAPISDYLEKKEFVSSSSTTSSGFSSSSASAVISLAVLQLAKSMENCRLCEVSLPRMSADAKCSFDVALEEAHVEARSVHDRGLFSVVLQR